MDMEFMYIRLNGFVRALLDGWQLPFIVEPMPAHHSHYAILMHREIGRGVQ